MIPGHFVFTHLRGKRVHLGLTGSVAACRAPDLVRAFVGAGVAVGCTLTDAALSFITPLTLRSLGADPVWSGPWLDGIEDPFAHLAKRRAADVLLIAPASADILARAAAGLAGDLLACQILACPKPCIFAPAMNPAMWSAPATQANVETLTGRGATFVGPNSGLVACGDQGRGRMAPILDIFAHSARLLGPRDLAGRKALVTLGPTWESFDSVRVWTNRSTGRMGAAMAMAAWLAGAEVCVVHGPVDIPFPAGMRTIPVETAREMHEAVMDLWPDAELGCCTAAVADFRPEPRPGKLKKADHPDGLVLELVPNTDILADMGRTKRHGQILVGFAAEAEDPWAAMNSKLKRKNLDLVVGNRIDLPGQGFASADNSVAVLDRHGRKAEWASRPKADIAWDLWQWVRTL